MKYTFIDYIAWIMYARHICHGLYCMVHIERSILQGIYCMTCISWSVFQELLSRSLCSIRCNALYDLTQYVAYYILPNTLNYDYQIA